MYTDDEKETSKVKFIISMRMLLNMNVDGLGFQLLKIMADMRELKGKSKWYGGPDTIP